MKDRMKKIVIALVLLTFSSSAFAQKIKVRRVKGNQAVVEFGGAPLQTGQVYELMAQDDFGDASTGSHGRDYVLGLSFSFSSSKSDATGSANVTDISLSTRFGWNLGTFELGPLFSYRANDESSLNTTSLKAGVFGDFNIIPNIPGEIFIYGLGGYLVLGSRDNGAGTKSNITEVFAGPFVKWFFGGSAYAIRFDGGYQMQKLSAESGDTTISGIGMTAGIQAYF
jgi:hypothetical protein